MHSTSTSPAVICDALTKRFGSRTAVDRLTVTIPAGVVAGLVGPNGAGKTTTMAMLLGLARPSSGHATVLGHDVGDPAGYLGRVGALIEAPAFHGGLSGEANLRLLAASEATPAPASRPCSSSSGWLTEVQTSTGSTPWA